MTLAGESPVHSSSSSDDFAAFLDAELELASSETSPDDQENDGFEEKPAKRYKVDTTTREVTDTLSKLSDENVCPHPGFFGGLCVKCGGQPKDVESGVSLGYIHKGLRLSNKEIDRLRGSDLENLLRAKKLILILDLDHTLLNSTRLQDVTPEEEYLKQQAESLQGDPSRSIFKLDGMHLLTKLRPFVRTFLKEASNMFEMYIYTMGERSYADKIAKILDPDKVYFDSRVISKSDSTVGHQKGLDVVLVDENIILILDDTEHVWKKHKENLILMERYHFFSSSCRQFGFGARSLAQQKKDECGAGGALSIILNVLKRAHEMFFNPALGTDLLCRDVKKVLKSIRMEILQGCKIVFSRIFPSGVSAEDQPIWMLAEELGAVCSTVQDSSVTHVVSTDRHTEKARWAVKNEKFLVTPQWIEAANFLWERQSEENFKVPSSFKEPASV